SRWWDGFHAISTSGFLALVVLGHPSHRQQSGRPGFHSQLLQLVNCLQVPTFRGFEEALKRRFCRRYGCCSSLRQGNRAHSTLRWGSGVLASSLLLTRLHSTVSGLRQPILDITPGLCFSDQPTKQMHTVGTYSCLQLSMRAPCWLLRSNRSFCVAVGSC